MKLPALLAASLLLGAASPALAETLAPVAAPLPPATVYQQPAAEPKDSINLSPLGLLFGDLTMTYEHLFAGGHGLIVDAGGGRDVGGGGSATHGTIGVGYRWHWRGKQNSGFLGVSLHQSVGAGTMVYDPDTAQERSYAMSVRSTTLTANVGKRWMLGDRLNITLRFGLGLGAHTATADASTAEAKQAESDMNAILSLLPVGAEGELSIGYTF